MQSWNKSRSPCGERGLKYYSAWGYDQTNVSLPVRGAWIEIPAPFRAPFLILSLPVRGAWIEMSLTIDDISTARSLPVRGAWIEIFFPPGCPA